MLSEEQITESREHDLNPEHQAVEIVSIAGMSSGESARNDSTNADLDKEKLEKEQLEKKELRKSEEVILKLFTGSQEGATMYLSAGSTYKVGSDLLSDIVILDDSVKTKHLEIGLHEKKLVLTNCFGALAVNGEAVEIDGQLEIEMNSVITVGNTDLYIGGPESLHSMGIADNRDDAKKPDTASQTFLKKHSRVLYLSAALIAFILCVFTILSHSPVEKIKSSEERVSEVENDIRSFEIKNLAVDFQKNKKVAVSGYLMSDKEFSDVLEALKVYGSRVSISVSSAQNILEQVTGLLSSYNLARGVKASFNDEDQLSFEGVAVDDHQWLLFTTVLSQDIPYVDNFDDTNVISLDDFVQKIRPELDKYKGQSQLSVVRVGEEVMIRGALDPGQLPMLEKELQKLRDSVGSFPNFAIQLTEAEDPLEGLVVRLVSNTGDPYFILDNGKRYKSGDFLDNGYEIAEILSSKIMFIKNGRQIELSI